MTTLYGIKNCDTVRKARRWLDEHGIDYRFHDLRDAGLDEARLRIWVEALGHEALLNKRSTSWRKLSDGDKTNLDEGKAMRLMLAQPTLVKRPVLEHGGAVHCGFSDTRYREIFRI